MEPLITVLVVLAIATFVTGLVLPLTNRRRDGELGTDEERLAAEVALWR